MVIKTTETRESTTCNPKELYQDACQHLMLHPYITPQEQAAKTDMLSVVSIQVFSFVYS